MNSSNKYYWDEDTLNYFRFVDSYMSEAELLNEVEKFVANNCSLEDGETEEILIKDLIRQILQK